MIYLYWYLAIGVAVLTFIYGAHRLTKEKKSDSIRDLLDAVNPDRKKLSYRLIDNIAAPIIAAVLIVVFWPVAAYIQAREMGQRKRRADLAEEREFAVERQHLLERLTVPEIEMREVVADPLKAAPELPFGHLNAAWQKFVHGKADGSELWSFSVRWQTSWGRKELRSGYVVVHGGAPGAHFLTVWKDITDEVEAGGAKHARTNDTTVWLRKQAD